MKSKYVKVNSVEDYFSLPKSEREYRGFYKKPYALEWDFFTGEKGWTAFYKEIKKQYPIQWFFREWMFSLDNPIYRVFYTLRHKYWDIKYAIKNFLKPVYPRWRKTVPRHKYADGVYLIIESNFNLILDFYYNDIIGGYVDWESDEDHKTFLKEVKDAVRWIEVERQELNDICDRELTLALNNKEEKDYNKRYKTHDEIEKQIFDKETSIINWMVAKRSFFWT